jgi:hypothetical protein
VNRPGIGRSGSQAVRDARRSDTLTVLVGVGLAAYGIVHLLIAWIALQVAWTHSHKNAGSKGALRTLVDQPFGPVLLWAAAVGLVALVVWQGFEAARGHEDEDGAKRVLARVRSAGRAVVYAALTVLVVKTVTSSGGSSNKQALTARLLNATGGQLLVTLIGLVIIGVGVGQIVVGVRRDFTKHLSGKVKQGSSGDAIVIAGQVGYIAKGVSLGIIGGLFVAAALTYNPKKAGGLDVALKTLRDQTYGPWLLSLVAIGLACFGLYCLAWARSPDT